MKKLLSIILALCLLSTPAIAQISAASGSGSYDPTAVAITGGTVNNTHINAVQGLVASSTGAAAANVTALQGSLDTNGYLWIDTCGTYYINATILISSNQTVDAISSCVELKAAPGMNLPLLSNADHSGGNSRVHINNIKWNGDKANQTVAYTAVDFTKLTDSWFWYGEFDGGLRTGTFPTVSSDGEGWICRNCDRVNVYHGYAGGNSYDGFKTRWSRDITFYSPQCGKVGSAADDNGRACVQMAGTNTLENTQYSERIIVLSPNGYHTTGTHSASSPITSLVYFHGCVACQVLGGSGYGYAQGVGYSGTATDNMVIGTVFYVRGTTDGETFAFNGTDSSFPTDRNSILDVIVQPISGASKGLVKFDTEASYNTVELKNFSLGGGSGTWTIVNSTGQGNTSNKISGFARNVSVSNTGALFNDTDLRLTNTDTHKKHDYTANSGASLTIDPVNGTSQAITLTAATTLTLASNPPAGTEKEIQLDLIQDGTGGWGVTWANVTWASGTAPYIDPAIGAVTRIGFKGTTRGWIGFAAPSLVGVTDASSASTGNVGEVITTTLASGSAVSQTTATVTPVLSSAYTAGDWMIVANVTFLNTTATPTELQAFLGTASGTSTTGQDTALNTCYATPTAAVTSATITCDISYRFNTSSSGTMYLKAKPTFSAGTITAFGSMTMRRVR